MSGDQTATVLDAMPFARTLGVELEAVSPDEVRGGLEWVPERCTAGGSLGAVCAYLKLPPGASTATIESKTNFLRAVCNGRVEAVSRPLHVGRTVIVVETDVRDADGRHVARVTQTQAVITA